jgi:phosphatidylglycerophosphatase A
MRRILASWFGTGLVLGRLRGSDMGSGTVGAAFAVPVAMVLAPLGWPAQLAAAMFVTFVSVWASDGFARDGGDPGWVVIDEAAGALIAMIGLGWPAGLVAWIVFRVADIFKPAFPGVAAAERLPGGWGITADDVVAGLYGLAAGWLVQTLI